ncbi:Calcium/proton exchanger [Xylariaceae sp. FL0255]|nr:Calcium/proton exchanger [Xylariaceae sp. FL0255]
MGTVNIYRTRTEARRHGRDTDNMPFAWLNFWRRINYDSPRKLEDEEAGSRSRSMPLEGEEGADVVDSQATTVGGPEEPNGSTNGMRKRTGFENKFKKTRTQSDLEDRGKPEGFTFRNQLQRTLFSSPINLLLLAAPAGIALWALKIPGPAVFVVNFIAIIPLAALLAESTEQVAMRTGDSLGGLINATFGNAVELIVAIIALTENQITVVQTSLVGSMLSNMLLVLGCCFVAGGVNRPEQKFQHMVAQTTASLLALAVSSLIVPTIFSQTPSFYDNDNVTSLPKDVVWQISHGVALILLLVYVSFLFFQLKTHADIFGQRGERTQKKKGMFRFGNSDESEKSEKSKKKGGVVSRVKGVFGKSKSPEEDDNTGAITSSSDVAPISSPTGSGSGGNISEHQDGVTEHSAEIRSTGSSSSEEEEEEEEEEPRLHFLVAVGTLVVCTVIIAICSEGLVSGIDSITGSVSEEFVGLILLPIVGNACEHATAVTVAIKDKMDLAIGVAIGSSLQISLFVLPVLVIIGWGIGNTEMTLAFDTFQVVVLFIAVLLVNYLIGDGKSHWLEGVQLITLYVIIALCAFYFPNGVGGAGNAT